MKRKHQNTTVMHFFQNKKLLISIFLLLLGSLHAQQSQTERLRNHLYLLASDSLQGRETGCQGGLIARQYLLEQYQAIGLEPYRDKYIHTFNVNAIQFNKPKGQANIVMVIPGNDPELKEEYIVLGAHYDHVGIIKGKIYNGADDNASGSSALIEIARQIYAHRDQLKRTVIIAAFDAEEEGLFGSKALVNYMNTNGDISKVKLMMSIDMVGWLSTGGALTLEGTSTLKDAESFLLQLGEQKGITIRTKSFENSIMTATDTEPFAKAGCPTLAVTTGLKSPYHKPEDDADLIDYDGLNLICDYIAELTLGWAADKPPLVPSGRLAAKHSERLRPVEIGPTLGIGLSSLRYPGSALKGKNQFEFHAGLSSRLNIKHVSVGLDFLFNYASMATANMNGTVYDLFDGRESDGQKSIILPLSIFWNPVENGAFYIGGGVNYRKLMGVDNSVYNTNLWGVQCSFGFRGGKFGLSYTLMYQITPYYISTTMPEVTSKQVWYTFTYML